MKDAQHILLVDDDPRLCRLLTRYLTAEGFQVETAANGLAMRRAMAEKTFDLVILDLRLPGSEDGLSLARELRASSDVSLIMLTGMSDAVDKVVGLELGADDYITKPFDRRELLARIRSVLRRAQTPARAPEPRESPTTVHFGLWRLDMARHELTSAEGERIDLTSYEFQLLSTLAQRPGRALSRDQILDLIANRDWQPLDRSVDVLVGKLRRKLRDDPRDARIIKTIRGVGYMLTPPEGE